MLDRIRKFFGLHVHNPELFLVGNICVVKCQDCGMESIPWEVSKEKADAARPHHANDVEKMIAIDKKAGIK